MKHKSVKLNEITKITVVLKKWKSDNDLFNPDSVNSMMKND